MHNVFMNIYKVVVGGTLSQLQDYFIYSNVYKQKKKKNINSQSDMSF